MGVRVAGLILVAGALVLSATTDPEPVERPACAELYVNGRPSGWCQNWPDGPLVPAPTSTYDGRRPPEPDRRPVEQNPTCWIMDAGWPRCREYHERTDAR